MPPAIQFLRRREAGEYLKSRYGFCSPKSLGKLATLGGGPEYHKAGPAVVYAVPKLDEWALAQLSGPCQSTTDYHHASRKHSPGRPRKAGAPEA
jgi:hypothetical protein